MILFIQRVFKSILFRFVPEFRPILSSDKISYDWIKAKSLNNEIGGLVKLKPPYNISNSKIGKGTYIAPNARVSMTTIGKFCSLGPNLICGWGIHPTDGISTHPYFYSTLNQNGATLATKDLVEERMLITIGNDVFIGANVTILDGVTIGNGAIIGAGAVVSKDIPDYAIAVGVPIQLQKYRFSNAQQEKLNKICWWNFDDIKLKKVNEYFFEVDRFINDMLEEESIE